jgi:hypothetical protein
MDFGRKGEHARGSRWAFQLRSHDEPLWPVGITINVGMSLVFAM